MDARGSTREDRGITMSKSTLFLNDFLQRAADRIGTWHRDMGDAHD